MAAEYQIKQIGKEYFISDGDKIVSTFGYGTTDDAAWILRKARYYIDNGRDEELAFMLAHKEIDAH